MDTKNDDFKKQLFNDIKNSHGLFPEIDEKTISHYEHIFDTFTENNKQYKFNIKYDNAISVIQAFDYSNTFKTKLEGEYNDEIIIENNILKYLIEKEQDIEVFLGEKDKKIVLYIIENNNGQIDYVKISDTIKISDVIKDIDTLKNNFNNGLASLIDSLIDPKISLNTRKITFTKDTLEKFYNFSLGTTGCGILFPGIITPNKPRYTIYHSSYIGRMNLILVYAIKGDDVRKPELNGFVYYDTFQLCPPYPQGQNHC